MILNQTDLGPVNITYGDLVLFTAEFFDDENITTIPSAAIIAVTYVNINNVEQTDVMSMALNDSFFNATWSSTNASSGLALWEARSAGHSSAAQLGIIRVINEDG